MMIKNNNTWITDPITPVLEPSSIWDHDGISSPYVIKNGNTYMMWYDGLNNGIWSTGLATSSDGINWTPYVHNPVLTKTESWEGINVGGTSIIYDGNKFLIWYSTNDNLSSSVAYAESSDGINWINKTKLFQSGPEEFDEYKVAAPSTIQLNGVTAVWYGGWGKINNISSWRINLASNGTLPNYSIITPTPSPSPTPTSAPTVPTTKVIIVPGMGGSWNASLIKSCSPGNGTETWIEMGDSLNLLKKRLTSTGYFVMPMFYDWRKTPNQIAAQLNTLIHSSTVANEKVHIVAHSLGGLVSRAYIEQVQSNAKIDSFLAVGTPFSGSVEAYLAWAGGSTEQIKSTTQRFALEAVIHYCALKHLVKPIDAIHTYAPSVQQTLPTFDYLRDKTSKTLKPFGDMFYKNGWLPNAFFAFPFYGIRFGSFSGTDKKTLQELTVSAPNGKDTILGLWKDGNPVNKSFSDQGDGLVLLSSSQFPGADNSRVAKLDHGELIQSKKGVNTIVHFFGKPENALMQADQVSDNAESGLVFIADSGSLDVQNTEGEFLPDTDGLVFIKNPKKGSYKLTFTPKTTITTFSVVQLLSNGKTFWRDYTINGKSPKQKIMKFDDQNPLENSVQE
jgi:hypothetical protein